MSMLMMLCSSFSGSNTRGVTTSVIYQKTMQYRHKESRVLLGVCFVAEDPKERKHLRQILSRATPKLSPIKLRHSDMPQDEGVNRLKDEMT
jgi:hypothetical protein